VLVHLRQSSDRSW